MASALRGQRAVALLHFLCFLWAVFALSQNLGVPRSVRREQDNTYAGQWKYLTFLNQFVAVAFWGLYAFDRELIYPEELDAINPSWLNHSMHTTILPLLVIELVICIHKYPRRMTGILGLCAFAAGYIMWIFWVYHVGGIWAYPVLGVLGPCEKAIFLIFAVCAMIIFYFLGEQLNKRLWAKRRKKCT